METQSTPKTKLEIIEEITSYFAGDPSKRAIKNYNRGRYTWLLPRCSYFDPETGNRCAVGMCIKDECFEEQADGNAYMDIEGSAFDVAFDLVQTDDEAKEAFRKAKDVGEEWAYSRALDVILKEEYRGHSTKFWGDLQLFHDTNLNFDSAGLTIRGEKKVKNLVARWGQG